MLQMTSISNYLRNWQKCWEFYFSSRPSRALFYCCEWTRPLVVSAPPQVTFNIQSLDGPLGWIGPVNMNKRRAAYSPWTDAFLCTAGCCGCLLQTAGRRNETPGRWFDTGTPWWGGPGSVWNRWRSRWRRRRLWSRCGSLSRRWCRTARTVRGRTRPSRREGSWTRRSPPARCNSTLPRCWFLLSTQLWKRVTLPQAAAPRTSPRATTFQPWATSP